MSERWPVPSPVSASNIRILDFIEYTRVYLALGLTVWVFAFALILNVEFGLGLAVIIFGTSFGIYAMNRRFDIEEDSVNLVSSDRRGANVLFLSGVILLGAAAGISLLVDPSILLSFVIALGCFAAYSVPLLPESVSYTRLKEIPFVKNLVIGTGSAGTLVSALVLFNQLPVSASVLTLFAWAFVCVVLRSIVHDIRDLPGDTKAGIQTIPVHYGLRTTKFVLHSLNLVATAIFYGAVVSEVFPLWTAVPGVVNLIGFLLVDRLSRENASIISMFAILNHTYLFFLLTIIAWTAPVFTAVYILHIESVINAIATGWAAGVCESLAIATNATLSIPIIPS